MRLIDANRITYQIAYLPTTQGPEKVWAATERDIENVLTIDPESLRPTGRWVDPKWNDMWQSMTATCSHCLERGEVRVRTNEHGMKVINSPSCPNCGAKMEG